MSKDTLHQIAETDTPQNVSVPNSWQALMVWAIGRFGGIVIATGMASYAAVTLYADHKVTNERLLSQIEKQATSNLVLSEAISSLRLAINEVSLEARHAHNTTSTK